MDALNRKTAAKRRELEANERKRVELEGREQVKRIKNTGGRRCWLVKFSLYPCLLHSRYFAEVRGEAGGNVGCCLSAARAAVLTYEWFMCLTG